MNSNANNIGAESLGELDAQIRAIIDEPSTSSWFRTALLGLLNRDPVDAYKDIQLLEEIAMRRLQLIEDRAEQMMRVRVGSIG